MGKPTGFVEFERRPMPSREPAMRLGDFYEIYDVHDEQTLREQGARCMDCGIPFCQSDTGCPIDNLIPEWNDLVFSNRWHDAYLRLMRTNNFPEFTGRICPAPCESACVLGIIEPAVTIKSIECAIIDRAFAEGWVLPQPPPLEARTGKRVAIIGSGPAGLAAADQLNQAGHEVTVYERDDRIGGLLMYGVPNMKLDKGIVQRRVDLLAEEGIIFKPNHNVGGDPSDQGTAGASGKPNERTIYIEPQQLMEEYDAVLLACGALKARLLDLPGSELKGVHRAMTFLHQNTKVLLDHAGEDRDLKIDAPWRHAAAEGDHNDGSGFLDAKDKHVIVIGGGDTGTDCIGTALRHGAKSVFNITRREREPDQRDDEHPWPGPTGTYYVDYGHSEGAVLMDRDPREYQVLPKAFIDSDGDGRVDAVRVARLEWYRDEEEGRLKSREVPDSDTDLPAELVLLAIGFTGFDTPTLVEQLGVKTRRGVVEAQYGPFVTNVENVFVAGDMRRGASLIVWAIAEGRGAARAIDEYLMGESTLPAPGVEAAMVGYAG